MVGCTRKLHNNIFAPWIINCLNYSSCDPQSMKEDFKAVDSRPVFNANDVNMALDNLRKLMVGRDRVLKKCRRTEKRTGI